MVTIEQFVEDLRSIRERDFKLAPIADLVRESPVNPDSLSPYVLFLASHYTRNLIYRCELFEILSICWDIGQKSRIHNHQNQNCWMSVPIGRLSVQNYEVIREEVSAGFCELREADRIEMDSAHPSCVDPARPVHLVDNPSEYGQRAVSLHIYSRPYDHCLVYSLESKACWDVPLAFDTEYGKRKIM